MLSRIILYSAQGQAMGDLDPSMVISAVRTEEINGEHSLALSTITHLYIGMRILMRDTTGKWREYVVDEEDEEHQSGRNAIGTYHAIWSIQYDLAATPGGIKWAASVDGTNNPVSASVALSKALEDSVMWRPGTCDVTTVAGASLYDGSCWDYLSTIVSEWGGEIDAEITVGVTGVVTRSVALMAHLGSSTAKRRFDWGRDLTRIRRTPDPGPYYCRVVPRGGGEGTDSDGVKYSDRCGIESENDGLPYLQDDDAAALFRTMLPNGEWFYPTKVVNYSLDTKDDAEELYDKALEDLYNHTRPNVSYEADVVQLATAGFDPRGVALGDDVQCVDRGFGDIPLRIQGRIVSMTVNEMNPSDITLTIGKLHDTLADEFMSLEATVGSVSSKVSLMESGGTAAYVRSLIERMNQELNAVGGWTYIVPNEGIVVYDIEVDDPLMGYNSTLGQYANSVVQIKGGGIRIANARKPQFSGISDWDWKSVFVSGHIAAELVTAASITTGYIGDPTDEVFLDFDNHIFQIGNRSVPELIADVDSSGVTAIDYGVSASSATAPTTWSSAAPTDVPKGSWLWVRTTYKDGTSTVTKAYAGEDGTSVSILGSYNTLADLQAAHPTGDVGDGYIVNGDLYVWDGSQWLNVGRIQGPAGQDGTSVTIASREVKYAQSSSGTTAPTTGWQDNPPSTSAGQYLWSRTTVNYNDGTNTVTYNVAGHGMDGTSVTITKTEYGTSTSASSQPSSWSTTTPTSIAQGSWLWVRTTYSNGSSATSKSYVGTDGEDGTSVYVKSSTKSGDVTTVVITDGDSDTTLTIRDGDDGTDGVNGLNGYVHTAWANNANGTLDFSTEDSENKLYLGVYTDNTKADSQSSGKYSWTLIKGANGAKGDKGDKGDTGDAARAYSIVISPDALRRDGDTITPSEITVSATVAVGTATPTTYMGRYRIEEYNGSTWTTKYTSSANESSKTYQPTSTARMVRCTLFAAGGTTTRLDSQTVPVLSDGADGANGTNGTNGSDAYSVWLTNDSHLFPASGSAALSGNVVTYIKAYKGTSLMRPVTIGTLPTPPTGMTLTKLNNGSSTTDAGIRVSVTTSLVTRSGTIDIPVTADGRSFTVTFSWALALKGDTGNGIASQTVTYGVSASPSTQPSSWQTSIPSVGEGQYLWTRTITDYTDPNVADTATYTYAKQGEKGGTGTSVSVSSISYQIGSSATTTPTSTWSSAPYDTTESKPYLWTKTVFTDGKTAYGVAKRGDKGLDGDDGVGIKSVVPQYYLSTSSTSATGGSWSSTPPTWSSGKYIWTRNFITWDSNPIRTSTTDAVYDAALTQANQQAAQARTEAADAAKVATNYLKFTQGTGLDVGYQNTSAKTRVNGSGVEIFDGAGKSAVLINTSGERIGHDNEARLQMNYHSMHLVDKENVKFFEAIDYRGTNSIADVTVEIRKIQGVTGWLLPHLVKTVQWVTSGGSRVPSSGTNRYSVTNSRDGYSVFGLHGTYANVANGTVIKIKYTTEQAFYSYLMGSRAANTAAGHASLAQGQNVAACGWGSHAEGQNTSAIGSWSHAEGYNTKALANCDHAEGGDTTASGGFSHAEGRNSNATGMYSHAEGQTAASGMWAHSEGSGTEASGSCAHSEGGCTIASAEYSHAQNRGTIAASACQTAIGRYNLRDTSNAFAFVIGNGTPGTANTSEKRSNAFAIRWDGSAPTQSANTGFEINTTNVKSVTSQSYRRCLGVVQISVTVSVKVAVAKGSSIVIGRLPAGYKPAIATNASAGSFNKRATIATNGDITLVCETAVTSTSWSATVRATFLTA